MISEELKEMITGLEDRAFNKSNFMLIKLIEEIFKTNDLNSHDNNGWTLLHYAVYDEDYELVELLLKNGVNINLQINRGMTPLILATRYENEEIIKLLLSYGADVNIKDNKEKTAFDYAKLYRYTNIVKLLENTERIKIEEQEEKELGQIIEEDKNKTLQEILDESRENIRSLVYSKDRFN